MSGYWPEFLKVALAHLLAVASPGPDFAIVLRQSLIHGRRTAVWTALGVGTAVCLHVTYSLLGLGILLRGSPVAFAMLKFSGAAYLAAMGLRALCTPPRSREPRAEPDLHSNFAPRAAWATGFFTNALNPKAALFFVALFSVIISPTTPKLVQVGYGIWISLTTMAWFSLVAYIFTRERARQTFLHYGHWIDRALGVVFIALAISLAIVRSVRLG